MLVAALVGLSGAITDQHSDGRESGHKHCCELAARFRIGRKTVGARRAPLVELHRDVVEPDKGAYDCVSCFMGRSDQPSTLRVVRIIARGENRVE